MTVAPGIPYVQIPDLTIFPTDFFGGGFPPAPISIKPFGVLVATGVYLGAWLTLKQARRLGLSESNTLSFIAWVVGAGFVLGHALDTVFYYPERVLEDPTSLVRIWDGLSSFGGFVGAAVGCFLFRAARKEPILPHAEVVASSFPVGWFFGRAGCAVAHDHPGRLSDAWIAVQYPDGGRFDLGLSEMVLVAPLAAAFLWLRRTPRPHGFYLGAMMLAYAPVRFALDFLRADAPVVEVEHIVTPDARYGGLTPAQWGCIVMLGVGAVAFARAQQSADA